jgi:uncharacterized membrane protein
MLLRLSVEDALKLVISGGLVTPPPQPAPPREEPSHAAKGEPANAGTGRGSG